MGEIPSYWMKCGLLSEACRHTERQRWGAMEAALGSGRSPGSSGESIDGFSVLLGARFKTEFRDRRCYKLLSHRYLFRPAYAGVHQARHTFHFE